MNRTIPAQLAILYRRKGVYVDTVDKTIYRGPYLQQWDYFDSTEDASAYIGCETDEVGAHLREGDWFGRGGELTINGVRFMTAIMMKEYFRPPLDNPLPRGGRRKLKVRNY